MRVMQAGMHGTEAPKVQAGMHGKRAPKEAGMHGKEVVKVQAGKSKDRNPQNHWKRKECVGWIQECFTVEPPRHDLGGEPSVKLLGFRPNSQSYRPRVGVRDQKSELQLQKNPRNSN